MVWTGPQLVTEVPTRTVPVAVPPTVRDRVLGYISYSCQRGEHDRCSTYPGKLVDKHPRGSGVKLRAAEIAPSCSDSCHG